MDPEERREQLLDAVLRVIVKQGVHKVSMDSVCKEAGVTRPVIYGHFSDTNHLLRESLSREEAAAQAQVAAVMPRLTAGGDPVASAISTLDGFLQAVAEAPDRWRAIFMLAESNTPAFRKRLDHNRRAIIRHFEEIARWAVREGLEPGTDVQLLARALFALLWEAGRLVLEDPETFPRERIVMFGGQLFRQQFAAGTSGERR